MVEYQPLVAQVRRVVEALDLLGEPLSAEVKEQLDKAIANPNEAAAVRAIQDVLDPLCLVGVNINPESRVKADQGFTSPGLIQNGWSVFLVKVHNEAGVTAPLRVMSPNAAPVYRQGTNTPSPKPSVSQSEVAQGWMDLAVFRDRPLKPTLSGLPLEYRLIQIYSRDTGRREAKLVFDVGQGTQDLGFRSDVDILFGCRKGVAVHFEVKDEDGRPTTASFLIRDSLGRIYPSPSKRLAPDFFFHPQVYRQSGESVSLGAWDLHRGMDPGTGIHHAEADDQRPGSEIAPFRNLHPEALGASGKAELVLRRSPRTRRRLRAL